METINQSNDLTEVKNALMSISDSLSAIADTQKEYLPKIHDRISNISDGLVGDDFSIGEKTIRESLEYIQEVFCNDDVSPIIGALNYIANSIPSA